MATTERVLSGSKTRGSKARIVYPDEYSGSNTLDTHLEGVYVNTLDNLYGSTVVKIRPNNDFLKIIDGKVYKGDLRPFDDVESPSSFAKNPESPALSGTNHPHYILEGSQITLRDHGSGKDRENKGSGWKVAPNHFRDDRDLGQTDLFQDATAFFDTANMDPLNIVTVDPLTLDVPSNMVNQSDVNLMDGAMEAFPIRSIIDRSNIEVPFQSRGIRADLVLTDAFRRSDTITFESPLIFSRMKSRDGKDFIQGTDPYLDGVEVFGLEYLSNRQKIIDEGSIQNYGPAITGSKGAYFSGSIPVQRKMWEQHKSLDRFASTGSSTGPIALPGYLMQQDASITPFSDITDVQTVTDLVSDETIAAPGRYGDLNFTFTVQGKKYIRPPLVSNYGVSSRPRDLVYHSRMLGGDGVDNEEPSLRSQTGLRGTEYGSIKTYVNSGSYKTFTGDSDDSPFTKEIGANAVVFTSRAGGSGFASHGIAVLDSCSGSSGLYEPPTGITIPGILSGTAPDGSANTLSPNTSPAFATLAQIFARDPANGPVNSTVIGNTFVEKMTKADFPCRPFAAGLWFKGDGLETTNTNNYMYFHCAEQHLKFSNNQSEHPSRYSGGAVGGYVGGGTQARCYAYVRPESEYAFVYVNLYNMDQTTETTTAYVTGYRYVSPSSNPKIYAALTDGNWHHMMYALHGSAGKTVTLAYANSKLTDAGAVTESSLREEFAVGGAYHYNWMGTPTAQQSESKWGAASEYSDPAEMPLMKVWFDGEELTFSYYSYNIKNGSQSFRCPTVVSDTLEINKGPTSSTNTETIHKFGAIGSGYDSTLYHPMTIAEPHLYVCPVTQASLTGSSGQCDEIEGWFNENIWTGKAAQAITALTSIDSLNSISGEILKNALVDMKVQTPGHSSLSRDCVSLGRGFVYDNTEYGFDSLVFGGLKK